MLKGKKQTAFQIFYDAIDIVEEKTKENGIEVWKQALANVTPSLEVKSKRIGGATFQIPTELRPARKQSVGMKNLINFARKRHEKSMAAKLAADKHSNAKRIPTEWLKPTRHSHTSDFNLC
jgi:small subunit ribosomal protein S7